MSLFSPPSSRLSCIHFPILRAAVYESLCPLSPSSPLVAVAFDSLLEMWMCCAWRAQKTGVSLSDAKTTISTSWTIPTTLYLLSFSATLELLPPPYGIWKSRPDDKSYRLLAPTRIAKLYTRTELWREHQRTTGRWWSPYSLLCLQAEYHLRIFLRSYR